MAMHKTLSSLITAGLALNAAPTLAAVSFQSLGHTADSTSVDAYSISADGTTVVGRVFTNDRAYAVAWTSSTGLVELAGLPAGDSFASGVSADGRIIVGTTQMGKVASAFRWSAGGGAQFLPAVEPGKSSYIADVSADGSAIVGYDALGSLRWTVNASNISTDRLPGPQNSSTNAISRDGRVVVGAGFAIGPALRWTDAGVEVLPDTDGAPTAGAATTNGDGSVVVGVLQDRRAFRWTASEGTRALGVLPGNSFSSASAVSDDGTLIVGNSSDEYSQNYHAFLWTEALGMVALEPLLESQGVNLSGWQSIVVYDVSADGLTLTGSGLLNGVQEAWIAHIPTPGSILPVAMLAPLAARRRRSPRSVGR